MARKIIRRFFIPYFFILLGFTLITALLSVLFLFERERGNILEKQYTQLEIIGTSLDQEWETILSTTTWIGSNTEFTPGSLRRNPLEVSAAMDELFMYANINGFIDHIILLYKDLPFAVTSRSTHRLSSFESVYGDELPENADFDSLAYGTEEELLPSRDGRYFYIRQTVPRHTAHPYCVILYRVGKERFRSELNNSFSQTHGGNIILIDRTGKTLLSLSETPTSSMVLYEERRRLEKSSLILVSAFPRMALLSTIRPFLAALALSFVILLFLGSLAVYIFSVRNSRPLFSLKEVMEKSLGRELPKTQDELAGLQTGISEINTLVSHSQEALKEKYTLNVLCGIYESRDELVLAGKPYAMDKWYDLTGIVVVNIIAPGDFQDKRGIIEYFEQKSGGDFILRGKIRAKEQVILLILTCRPDFGPKLGKALQEYCRELEETRRCRLYCALGSLNTSPRKLPFSLDEANSIMGRGLFSRENPVLTREDLLQSTHSDGGWADFTKKATRDLNLAMLSGTEEDVRLCCRNVAAELAEHQGGILHIRLLMENLLMNIRTFLTESWVESSQVQESYLDQSYLSIESFQAYLLKLCLRGNREFSRRKSATGMELRKQIIDFVEENYNNPQLTIESMADHFSITRQYLTRLFKEQMGKPVSDYIKDLRLNESRRLLRCTDLKVESIVREVGYSDTSSFIRNFRSREGMTPGQYRKKQARTPSA